jgi:prophage antirepressor-like protein/ribosomal protein L44E
VLGYKSDEHILKNVKCITIGKLSYISPEDCKRILKKSGKKKAKNIQDEIEIEENKDIIEEDDLGSIVEISDSDDNMTKRVTEKTDIVKVPQPKFVRKNKDNFIQQLEVTSIEHTQISYDIFKFDVIVMYVTSGKTEMWFDFLSVCTQLDYSNKRDPIGHIKFGYILTVDEFRNLCNVAGIVLQINKRKDEKFINLHALLELIAKSGKELAEELNYWIHHEILPTLLRSGTYSIQQFEFPNYYDAHDLKEFDKKKVVYIGYIGLYEGEHYFKYGISEDVVRRDHDEHKKTYKRFDLIYVGVTDNNKVVENKFKIWVRSLNLQRKIVKNNKEYIEIFCPTPQITYHHAIEQIKKLISDNLTDTQRKAEESQTTIAVYEKKDEMEFRKLDLQCEAIKLEQQKEKTKRVEMKNKGLMMKKEIVLAKIQLAIEKRRKMSMPEQNNAENKNVISKVHKRIPKRIVDLENGEF